MIVWLQTSITRMWRWTCNTWSRRRSQSKDLHLAGNRTSCCKHTCIHSPLPRNDENNHKICTEVAILSIEWLKESTKLHSCVLLEPCVCTLISVVQYIFAAKYRRLAKLVCRKEFCGFLCHFLHTTASELFQSVREMLFCVLRVPTT